MEPHIGVDCLIFLDLWLKFFNHLLLNERILVGRLEPFEVFEIDNSFLVRGKVQARNYLSTLMLGRYSSLNASVLYFILPPFPKSLSGDFRLDYRVF